MKLRNVYDALELKSYKEALNLVNKLLKKEPQSSLLKALKCNALYRQSRLNESVSIAKDIITHDVNDTSIAELIQDVLWESGYKEEIGLLYEKLSKANPQNERFHRDWFAAMVHFQDPSGQQKAAMTLYKNYEKQEYIFRAISSNMDLHRANQYGVTPASDKSLFGLLAYRMCQKSAKEKKIQRSEQFHLYIECVLAHNKHQEALTLLNSDLGRQFPEDIDLQVIRLQLLLTCEKWEEAHFVVSDAIQKGTDDWQYYNALVEIYLKLAHLNLTTLQKGRDYLLDQMKTGVKRNPHLAYVRLISRAFPQELLLASSDYYSNFKNRSVCFEDLHQYILLLDNADQKSFVAFVEQVVASQNTSVRGLQGLTLHEVTARVNSMKIEFLLSINNASDVQKRQFIEKCMHHYTAFLSHNDELEETDNTPGDDVLLLAIYTLLDVYDVKALSTTVVILESALSKSKYNYRIRLLLIHLYITLGAPSLAVKCYECLNIKQIQYDTMSHHLLTRISSIYPTNDTMNLMNGKVRRIYSANLEETPNMICLAYEHGTYSQIRDFFIFRERLEKSLWLYILEIECTWTARKLGDLYSAFPGPPPERWFDNRDQKVLYDATKLGQDIIEKVAHPNKDVGEEWTSIHLHIEGILCALAKGKDFRTHVSSLRSVLSTESDFSSQLSQTETWRVNLLLHLSEILGRAMDEKDLRGSIMEFQECLYKQNATPCKFTPGWEMLHSCNTILSVRQVLPLFRRASGLLQKQTDEVARILETAEKYLDDLARQIHECLDTYLEAKKLRDMLDCMSTQTSTIMSEIAGADCLGNFQSNENDTLQNLVNSQLDGIKVIRDRRK